MKKIYTPSLFILVLLFLFACEPSNQFEKFCGQWAQDSGETKFVETWKCSSEGVSGYAFRIESGDTVFGEEFWIHEQGDQIALHIKASGQNNGQAIPFNLEEKKDNTFLFSNYNHDFPKRIRYTFHSSDSLTAIVDDGSDEQALRFNFSRIEE